MNLMRNRPVRVVLCAMVATGGVMAATPSSAFAADTVSQATAQAVNLNLLNGVLNVAVSNPATSATNDGTQSNAEVHAQPLVSLLGSEKLVQAGALSEAAEANQNGSSYGCAGIVSPGGQVQVGDNGRSCTPTGNGKGGVTIDLGQLPGIGVVSGLLKTLGIPSIKITVDAITAHGYEMGTDPADLGATLVGVNAHLGALGTVNVPIDPAPNQDLLGAVLGAIAPKLGLLGTQISNLLKGLVSLTTNYQPDSSAASGFVAAKAAGPGDASVSGLHISLLNNTGAVADLAKVSVGPNAPTAPTDAFSFANLPIIFGGIAALIALGFGVRFGVRRVRAFV
jgi:hypothetical protein